MGSNGVTEPSNGTTVTFDDAIHGRIQLEEYCLKFIDTKEFQRLRYIHQLGTVSYFIPSATHPRFEHSIGTCHLASTVARHLKSNQPELEIEEKDIAAVTLAGLCHDLGHGIFSHATDNEIYPSFGGNFKKHEERSCDIIDVIIDRHNIEIDDDIIRNAKSMIVSQPPEKGKRFLWDIVANSKNGIDVDKFDYIARDAYYCNFKSSFDHLKLISSMRVIENEICFDEHQIDNVYELFNMRYKMHRNIYTHKTVKAIEFMLVDCIIYANDFLNYKKTMNDISYFLKFDDRILHQIHFYDDVRLSQSKKICERLEERKIYDLVHEFLIPSKFLDTFEKIELSEINSYLPTKLRMDSENFFVQHLKIDYGKSNQNPVDSANFYSKKEINSKFCIQSNHTNILPLNFKDLFVRLYSKKEIASDELPRIKEAFRTLCEQRFGNDSRAHEHRKRTKDGNIITSNRHNNNESFVAKMLFNN